MKGYGMFFKKELMENVRTHRLFVMFIIFLIFGFMSPLFAKITPMLLTSLSGNEEIISSLQIPEPTALDSYAQFFKNIGQMGMLAMLLIFSGMLSKEIQKGTLIPVLTRGLPRSSVILAKFTASSLIWTVCYLLSFGVVYVYTIFLFPSMNLYHLVFAVFAGWMFGIFLLSLFLWMSCAMKGSYGGMLGTMLVLAALLFLQMIPDIQKFNPMLLISDNVAMLQPGYPMGHAYMAMGISVVAMVIFMFFAITLFKRKQL